MLARWSGTHILHLTCYGWYATRHLTSPGAQHWRWAHGAAFQRLRCAKDFAPEHSLQPLPSACGTERDARSSCVPRTPQRLLPGTLVSDPQPIALLRCFVGRSLIVKSLPADHKGKPNWAEQCEARPGRPPHHPPPPPPLQLPRRRSLHSRQSCVPQLAATKRRCLQQQWAPLSATSLRPPLHTALHFTSAGQLQRSQRVQSAGARSAVFWRTSACCVLRADVPICSPRAICLHIEVCPPARSKLYYGRRWIHSAKDSQSVSANSFTRPRPDSPMLPLQVGLFGVVVKRGGQWGEWMNGMRTLWWAPSDAFHAFLHVLVDANKTRYGPVTSAHPDPSEPNVLGSQHLALLILSQNTPTSFGYRCYWFWHFQCSRGQFLPSPSYFFEYQVLLLRARPHKHMMRTSTPVRHSICCIWNVSVLQPSKKGEKTVTELLYAILKENDAVTMRLNNRFLLQRKWVQAWWGLSELDTPHWGCTKISTFD